jgi:hypothetical protein
VKFKVGVVVNQEGVEAFKSGGFAKMHGWRSKRLHHHQAPMSCFSNR